MKLVKKLRKRWQMWRFLQKQPQIAECRAYLRQVIKLGNAHPVGRAKRGWYD